MKLITFLLATSLTSFALPIRKGETFRVAIKGEYIVHGANFKSMSGMGERIGPNTFLLKTSSNKNKLSFIPDGATPNYEYFGDYMESVNDELFPKQRHHYVLNTLDAWKNSRGSSEIVIAVTDNEFEIGHDDLLNSWWINKNEIPNNNIDDDNNGYVDDVKGWDFVEDDNNVDVLSIEKEPTHGTHVAGTIAAEANNGIGVVGVAPGVKVMPLRWYGKAKRWTSALIAKTYYYAVDNGANIISTSYNIDQVVTDKAYKEAVKYAVQNDVLVFNSAGNGSKKNPKRQMNEDIILVCSVKSKRWWGGEDRKSGFSNYGTGIDICAPGDPILSTVQGKFEGKSRYGELQGTSMSTPVAAAVAGLIWSHNPNFTAKEVRARLMESADDISRKNFFYKGMLGAGRVNAAKALK